MATKIPGETYRGEGLHVPLSADGQVAAYVWPLRILSIQGQGCGGPTIGVEVGNEEIIRFDCHEAQGHWHRGGYDRLERPGNSHVDFPEGLQAIDAQVDFALLQIGEKCGELLAEAQHEGAAQLLDQSLVQTGLAAIKAHIEKNSGLRPQAIAENLIVP